MASGIRRADLGYGAGAWFVETSEDEYRNVSGYCICPAMYGPGYEMFVVGSGPWNLSACTIVPDDQVPNEIWVELAKWRLLSGVNEDAR